VPHTRRRSMGDSPRISQDRHPKSRRVREGATEPRAVRRPRAAARAPGHRLCHRLCHPAGASAKMAQGAWHRAHGTGRMAQGAWHRAHGTGRMLQGAWHRAHGTGRHTLDAICTRSTPSSTYTTLDMCRTSRSTLHPLPTHHATCPPAPHNIRRRRRASNSCQLERCDEASTTSKQWTRSSAASSSAASSSGSTRSGATSSGQLRLLRLLAAGPSTWSAGRCCAAASLMQYAAPCSLCLGAAALYVWARLLSSFGGLVGVVVLGHVG